VPAPLADIRVIAVEQYGAGPFGTMQLSDLGADVVKIEDPSTGGDVARYVPPFHEDEHSLFFESFNRNKRSLALDLRVPESRPIFERLVEQADVVTSNLRGDQAEKLGLRFTDLKSVKPTIVCVALSGFGATGPRRALGAYDYTIQGLAGWQSITGEPHGPPTKSGLPLVDLCGGYVAAIAMLAGVHAARRDGIGCDFDLSLFDVALSQLTYIGTWAASRGYEPVRRADSAHQSMVPFQNLTAKDGWIVVACPKEALWRRFCAVIGRPDLPSDDRFAQFADRDRNRDVLVPLLNEALVTRTVLEWCDAFDEAGVPAARVNTVGEALLEPQAQARGRIVDIQHPVLGEIRHLRSPYDSAVPIQRGPFIGEHTSVLLEEIGVDRAEQQRLADLGVFGAPPRKEQSLD
jgi:crotonobetainyl-CoA:carnitine CoA-transferase CaiB-like acyl-CoA transferase